LISVTSLSNEQDQGKKKLQQKTNERLRKLKKTLRESFKAKVCESRECMCRVIMLQPQSDLSGVIQVLVCVFGEEPPVFAKPQSQPAAATQPPYPPHMAQPPPPAAAATAGYAPYPTSGLAARFSIR